MSSKNIYGFFYIIAGICILLFMFFSLKEMHTVSGWMLMAFFLSIAFAFRGSKTLKGLSYTMLILSVVSIAMYHPQYFKTIGDYKLSALIIPLLQIIMFGMGTELSLKDFANVIKMPKGIIIGVGNNELPVLIGELGSFSEDSANFSLINKTIHEYAVEDKNSRISSTKDLQDKGDHLHLNSKGQRAMGKRFAKEYLKTL